jgi:hypothetical protein
VLKLYRLSDGQADYWETWQDPSGDHIIHWGELGTEGENKTIPRGLFGGGLKAVEQETAEMRFRGFAEIDADDHLFLIVEFPISGDMGSEAELDKLHRLEASLNEILGWTGLGECDGNSIGSGTMEAACSVVDFEVAKRVIEQRLIGTEFADYSRIYKEGGE